jgi:phage tail-like protein
VPEATLLRAFRFQVKLRKSAGGAAGAGASAGASFGASASAGFSASAGASLGGGLGAGAGFGASASASASASAGVGVGGLGAAASASFSASAVASASFGAGASIGAGVGIGGPAGDLLGDGGFQECSGLEIEQDVQEIVSGGENARVVRRAGRAKYQHLVLKRGMFFAGGAVNLDLWRWIQNTVNNVRPVARYDGTIEVMDVGDVVVATWTFTRGLPARIRGPTLNAQTGEIAIEELHIAHEGLRLGAG